MLHEHSQVVLNKALPHLGLEPGDIGIVVHVYAKGEAYEIEFVAMSGTTIGLETLSAADVKPVSATAVAHAREREVGSSGLESTRLAPAGQSVVIPSSPVDLTLAIRKLHELAHQDGDLGAEYWNSVIKLLSANGALHAELLRSKTGAKSSVE